MRIIITSNLLFKILYTIWYNNNSPKNIYMISERDLQKMELYFFLKQPQRNRRLYILHFCLLWPDRQTDGQRFLQNRCQSMRGMCSAQKKQTSILIRGQEHRSKTYVTDGWTNGRTDICNYRVASLLKMGWSKIVANVFANLSYGLC